MTHDPLAPARGIVVGLILGVILWALIIFGVVRLLGQGSVTDELAHRAVDSGVFAKIIETEAP